MSLEDGIHAPKAKAFWQPQAATAAAEGAALVFTSPPADSDLRDVAADDDGLLGGLGPDAVWVDHSTARRLSIPLPVTAVVDQFLADVERMGGSRWDWCSLMERQRSHRTS